MAAPDFAVFKYQHTGRVRLGLVRAAILLGLIAAAVLAGLVVAAPLGFVLMIVVAVAAQLLWPRRVIVLGPRYLLCGDTILYYRNVRALRLVPGQQLAIQSEGRTLNIERKRFPTGARKAAKIEASKQAKFDKVTARIIRQVVQATPGVELGGIDRRSHLSANRAKGKS